MVQRKGTGPARAVIMVLAGSVLAGCAGGEREKRLDPSYTAVKNEHAFAMALQKRYLDLATRAYDRGDPAVSDFYALRSIMAVEGKMVAPHPATSRAGRQALHRMNAAFADGARHHAPEDAARAQSFYDCWVVETGPQGDADQGAACQGAALAAIDRLDPVASVGPAPVSVAAAPGIAAPLPVAPTPAVPFDPVPVATLATPVAPFDPVPVVSAPVPAVQFDPVPVHSAPAPVDIDTVGMLPLAAPVTIAEPAYPAPHDEAAVAMIDLRQAAEAPVFTPPRPVFTAPEVVAEAAPRSYTPPPAAPVRSAATAFPEPAPVILDLPDATPAPSLDIALAAPAPVPAPEAAPLTLYEEPVPDARVTIPALGAMGEDAGAAMAATARALKTEHAVYFNFDSDTITPEAEDILLDIAAIVPREGIATVLLLGHTDSAGASRYNQLLALRRAQAVRAALAGRLGDDIAFEILPVGEGALAEETGDGIAEARNRRVEIVLR